MTIESFGGAMPRRLLLAILLLQAVDLSIGHGRKFSFTMPGQDSPTILLEADFVLEIKAFENNMVVAAWVGGSHDHPNIEIFGVSDKKSTMELRFPMEGITWGLSFNEKSVNDIAVDRYVRFTPEVIFPPFDKLTYPLTYDDKGYTDYHSALKSFQCDRTTKRIYKPKTRLSGKVTFEISVVISHFKVQAYHVKDGKFSPADHCEPDHPIIPTTPSHVLTSKKTTPPSFFPMPGGAPKHTFIVNETINNDTVVKCISMEGRVSFEIAYYVYDGRYRTTRKMVRIGIPEQVKIEGVCQLDAGSQQMVVKFLNNWEVEFIFGMNVAYSVPTEQGDYQSKLDYSIHSVSLKYNIDDDLTFPQAFKSEGSNFSISFTEHDNLPRKKASSNFFVCNTPRKFRMSEDVTLILSDFKFKAFIQDGDTDFYGIPNTCEEDMKQIGASTLVVVVGCLVITFSLVIFIALLALISVKCRTKRKRRKYQSL